MKKKESKKKKRKKKKEIKVTYNIEIALKIKYY